MNSFIYLLVILFFLFLTIQKFQTKKRRNKLKCVIHVNGIRGKSSTSRLIDAGLRAGEYKVFTKVTGTAPRVIINGVEKEILRKGKANIREQIEVLKWAERENTEILVLECMAVNPELQKIAERDIVKADICVITNVREDHLDEMGNSLDEIALSLANTLTTNGKNFICEKKYLNLFKEIAEKRGSEVFLVDNLKKEYEKIDFPANVALAIEVCKSLGVNEEKALEGMKNYLQDSGVLKTILYKNEKNKIYFINAMAANDPTSTEIILEKIKKESFWQNKKILLVNNRKDRLRRSEQYIKFIKKFENLFDEVIIFGEANNLLKKMAIKEKIVKEIRLENNKNFIEKIREDSLIFAVGNICGVGKELLNFLEEKGREVSAKPNIDNRCNN